MARSIADTLSSPVRRVRWSEVGFSRDIDDHSERVASLAVQFGVSLGLNPSALQSLYHGALFHDAGKIDLPEGLLNKQGALTENDWHHVRQHPQLGFELARARGVADLDALRAILHHHERWDGDGYPLGLKHRAIPVSARIVSLCDVFDALRSVRSYKSAWSLDLTLDYISKQSGRQFDPELAPLFVRFLESQRFDHD